MRFLVWLAILPSLVIAFFIYKADKQEREPKRELLKAFLLGFVAIIITLLLSYLFKINTIDISSKNIFNVATYSFLAIGLIEEFSKWICTVLFLRKNKNFNYLFDGIVYATFVSLGFATIENILYTLAGGIFTGILRALTTVPAHAFFAITSGYFLSLAKREIKISKIKSNLLLLYSLFIPFLLHGFYDFCLLMDSIILFNIYLIFVVCLYSFSFYEIKKMMNQEGPF